MPPRLPSVTVSQMELSPSKARYKNQANYIYNCWTTLAFSIKKRYLNIGIFSSFVICVRIQAFFILMRVLLRKN